MSILSDIVGGGGKDSGGGIGGILGGIRSFLPTNTSTNMSGSGTTSGTATSNANTKATTKTLSPEVVSMLEALVTGGSFSKQAAVADSANAVTGAIQETMQKYMPSIAAEGKGSGISGDSMTQQLANQTAVQAAVQGSKVKMDAINNYGTIFKSLTDALTAGSPQVADSTSSQTDTNKSSQTSTQNTTQSSGMTIICTKFYELGYMDVTTMLADAAHGRQVRDSNPAFYAWYLSWATYVVSWMAGSPVFSCLLWYSLAKYWARDMAWRQHHVGKPSYYGRVIYTIGKGVFHSHQIIHSVYLMECSRWLTFLMY